MSGLPHKHGSPSLRNPAWDPLWSACQEAALSVSFHIATEPSDEWIPSDLMTLEGNDITEARLSTLIYLQNAGVAADLMLSGILCRFPKLNFIVVESGMGWAPFVLEAVDHRFKKNKAYQRHPEFGDMLPSDYFRRQVWINFWFESLKPWHLEIIGTDHLLWETDYPHATGLYAESISETIDYALGDQPEDVREKVLWDNPATLYRRSLQAQQVSL